MKSAMFVLAVMGCQAPIRIGTLLPLSGPDANIGLAMKNAMTLAVDEVNRRGGLHGRKVELVALDEYPERDKADRAAQKLAADGNVLVVAADFGEDGPMLTQTTLHRAGLANVIPGAWDSIAFEYARRSPEKFRIVAENGALMRQVARYHAEVLHARRVRLFHDASFLGQRLAVMYRQEAPHSVTVDEVELNGSARELEGQVVMTRLAAPDAVLFTGSPKQGAALLSQLRAAGVTAPFHIAAKLPPTDIRDLAKGDSEGVTASFVAQLPDDSSAGRAFLASYQLAGFKESPGAFGLIAYAAAQVMLAAVDHSALTRSSVLVAVRVGVFDTVLGQVHFDANAQAAPSSATLYQIRDGHWRPLYRSDGAGRLQAFAQR